MSFQLKERHVARTAAAHVADAEMAGLAAPCPVGAALTARAARPTATAAVRAASGALSYLRVCTTIVALLAIALMALAFLFVHCDVVGVAVTEALVREMMPRPERYARAQPTLDAAAQLDLSSISGLLRVAGSEMDRLVVTGLADFGIAAGTKRGGPSAADGAVDAFGELFPFESASFHRPEQSTDGSAGEQQERERGKAAFPFLFHRPNLAKYGPHQWLWDSCFHVLITTTRDPARAVHELLSLFAMQDDTTGFVPEMTYWRPDGNQHGIPGWMYGYSDPERRFTDLTQMPMFAYAVERVYMRLMRLERDAAGGGASPSGGPRVHGDASAAAPRLSGRFLDLVLPWVLRALRYWRERRDVNGNDLVSIIHPWESGLDASPLYDPVHGFFYRGATDAAGAPGGAAAPRAGIGNLPRPDELYPKFIVLLWRYRHRHGWNVSDILRHCPDRFDVEDVGVNAVLADGFRLVAQLARHRLAMTSSPSPGQSGTKQQRRLQAIAREADEGFFALAYAIFTKAYVSGSRSGGVGHFRSFGWSPAHQGYIALTGKTIQSVLPLLLLSDAAVNNFLSLQSRAVAAGRAKREVTEERLREMRIAVLRTLTDPTEYLQPFGPPTTSARSPAFDPRDSSLMWRGPTWPTTNWFVFHAAWRLVVEHRPRGPAAPTNHEDSKSILNDEKDDDDDDHLYLVDVGRSGSSEAFSPVDEERLAEHSSAAAWAPSNIAARILAAWLQHHREHGFHEYYCPRTGAPLGQAGLGMSHAVIGILDVLEDPMGTLVGALTDPFASARDRAELRRARRVEALAAEVLAAATRRAGLRDDRVPTDAPLMSVRARGELEAVETLLDRLFGQSRSFLGADKVLH